MTSIRERLSGDRQYSRDIHGICMEWVKDVINEDDVDYYFNLPLYIKQKEHIKNLIIESIDRILAKEMYECMRVNVNMIQTFICGIFLVCYKYICGIDWMSSDENKFIQYLQYMTDSTCSINDIVAVGIYILKKYDWVLYVKKDNEYDVDLYSIFVVDIQQEINKEEKDLMWERLKELTKM